jgi:hypothetical protein
VVTAGWLGATARPFDKYAELWAGLGSTTATQYTVVGVRPPMACIMLPPYGDLVTQRFAQQLLAAAAEQEDAPILVHLFR